MWSSVFNSLQKTVAHFGRFSMFDRNAKTSTLDAFRARVWVLVFICLLHLVLYRTKCSRESGLLSSSKTYEVPEPGPYLVKTLATLDSSCQSFKFGKNPLSDRPEATRLFGEVDARRTAILRIGSRRDEGCFLHQANHCCHGLLGDLGPPGQFTKAQTVLFVEGDKNDPERGTHLRESLIAKPRIEKLIPML